MLVHYHQQTSWPIVLPLHLTYTLTIRLLLFSVNLPYTDSKHPSFICYIHFPLSRSFQSIRPYPRPWGKEFLAPRLTPSWRITPCRFSATTYFIHSHLPSTSGGGIFYPQGQEAPCRGAKDAHDMILSITLEKKWRNKGIFSLSENWRCQHCKRWSI
jgi:hypothetical protein